MATFLDITPALGRGLDFAQNFPGGYDAIDLRRSSLLNVQEGVTAATTYKVVQRAAGANMSVDVGVHNGGSVLVKGDDVTAQGLYHVPQLASVANLDVQTADPTNPRIDQVLVEAIDAAHTGGGITRARVYVLTGSPQPGATLDNRTGAAALPASTVRLADILVPAASASVTTANIRDRRPWANGAFCRILDATASSLSTTTELTVGNSMRIECSGVPVIYSLRAKAYNDTSGGYVDFIPKIDGVVIDGAAAGFLSGRSEVGTAAYGWRGDEISVTVIPSAGSHVFEWFFQRGTALGNAVIPRSATLPICHTIQELVRQNAQNN